MIWDLPSEASIEYFRLIFCIAMTSLEFVCKIVKGYEIKGIATQQHA